MGRTPAIGSFFLVLINLGACFVAQRHLSFGPVAGPSLPTLHLSGSAHSVSVILRLWLLGKRLGGFHLLFFSNIEVIFLPFWEFLV